ncbi:hypothetical protein LSTR_LSTR017388 [Laodelphax striatellus]|uniref:Uncharacterized protein n=1 Tax=Laodelphax striatellus TaxID=195883 RepID=A0A482XLH8_LAOST|nr:hypothetical protein LSTR_LSTR017388 [Laodelphax striatellus]
MGDCIHQLFVVECWPVQSSKPTCKNYWVSNSARNQEYARTQDLYKRNPYRLADCAESGDFSLLKDNNTIETKPPLRELHSVCSKLRGTPSTLEHVYS